MPQHIQIEKREQKFTSRKAAVSFAARGIAEWANEARTAIRFLEPEEQFQARAARQEQCYWSEITAQRGGQEVAFHWHPSISNGYVVMGATPIAIHERTRLAQGASEGGKCYRQSQDCSGGATRRETGANASKTRDEPSPGSSLGLFCRG